MQTEMFNLRNGFLPAYAPLERLPEGFAFSIWNELCDELPTLLRRGFVRKTLAGLPPLPETELVVLAGDARMAECAARKVFFLGSAFVHPYKNEEGSWERAEHLGGKAAVVVKTIPAPLARAMYFFSQHLNRKPILSYASYCLNNWQWRKENGELTLDNSEIIDGFLKTPDEDWFIKIHWVIENRAIPALQAIQQLPALVHDENTSLIAENLLQMTSTLYEMLAILRRMPEGCSTDYYWNQVRPFIFFFDSVIYDGVEAFSGRPQNFFGETGAQSSLVPTFDTILGIQHRPTALIGHIRAMRDYMPEQHRAFLAWLEFQPSLRAFVIRSRSRILMVRYNECLNALHAFRSQHLEWAKEYIAEKDKNPYGTGGTRFLPFLQQIDDETLEHILPVAAR